MPRVATPGTKRLSDYRTGPRCCGAFIGGRTLIDYRVGQPSLIDYRAEPKPRGAISSTRHLIDYRAGLMPRVALAYVSSLSDYGAQLRAWSSTGGRALLDRSLQFLTK